MLFENVRNVIDDVIMIEHMAEKLKNRGSTPPVCSGSIITNVARIVMMEQ